MCTYYARYTQPSDCSSTSSPPPPPTLNATATAAVVTRTYYDDHGIVAGLRRTTRNSAHLQCRQTCVVYEWSVVVVSRRSSLGLRSSRHIKRILAIRLIIIIRRTFRGFFLPIVRRDSSKTCNRPRRVGFRRRRGRGQKVIIIVIILFRHVQ